MKCIIFWTVPPVWSSVARIYTNLSLRKNEKTSEKSERLGSQSGQIFVICSIFTGSVFHWRYCMLPDTCNNIWSVLWSQNIYISDVLTSLANVFFFLYQKKDVFCKMQNPHRAKKYDLGWKIRDFPFKHSMEKDEVGSSVSRRQSQRLLTLPIKN